MTKHRFFILLIAVLTAITLCACGDTVESDSAPEGLDTFGVTLDPSAQPSAGQTIAGNPDPANSGVPTSAGNLIEGDSQPSFQPNDGEEATTPDSPSATSAPSTPPPATSTAPTTTPSPSIAPPEPASTATVDQVMEYIGKSVSELIADLGYPQRSDYDYVDEENPDAGEVGTLYFNDFTVTTLRDADGEIITAVTPD